MSRPRRDGDGASRARDTGTAGSSTAPRPTTASGRGRCRSDNGGPVRLRRNVVAIGYYNDERTALVSDKITGNENDLLYAVSIYGIALRCKISIINLSCMEFCKLVVALASCHHRPRLPSLQRPTCTSAAARFSARTGPSRRRTALKSE